jgi:NAD(P)H-hydrate epimerase
LKFLEAYDQPLVLDADALNIISRSPENLKLILKKQLSLRIPKNLKDFSATRKTHLKTGAGQRKSSGTQSVYYSERSPYSDRYPGKKRLLQYNRKCRTCQRESGDVLTGILTSLLAGIF